VANLSIHTCGGFRNAETSQAQYLDPDAAAQSAHGSGGNS